MKIKNIQYACRSCLQEGENCNMKSIYDKDEQNLLILTKIEECGGIKINKDNLLPESICSKCNEILGVAYKFRMICKNSDNYLQFLVRSDSTTNNLSEIKEDSASIDDYQMSEEEEDSFEEYEVMDDGTFFKEETEESNHSTTEIKSDNEKQIKNNHIVDVKQVEVLKQEYSNNEHLQDIDYNMIINGSSSPTTKTVTTEKILKKNQMPKNQAMKTKTDNTSLIYLVKRKPGKRKKQDTNSTEETELKSNISSTEDGNVDSCNTSRNKEDISLNSISKHTHICDICGNTYDRKYALEAHIRRHRGEKPFECEICKKSFALNFQLTRHMRCHTGQKPYKCQYCDRTFSDRSTNVKHERIHTNERPYKCETCGKTFTYSNVLKVHKATHTGEKPYICKLCNKGFSQLHHLRAHLQTQLHKHDTRVEKLLLETDAEVTKTFYDMI